MGHFARINNDSIVEEVIVINNDVLSENILAYPETEPVGRAFIANTLGLEGEWRQTSFNGNFRGRYAGIGYRYDRDLDEFLPPEVAE